MGEWTKEPWEIASNLTTARTIIGADGRTICVAHLRGNGHVAAEADANAVRIRDCVNALAGIPDPAATMEEVVDVAKAARDQLNGAMSGYIGGSRPDLDWQAQTREIVSDLGTLLAKLGRG